MLRFFCGLLQLARPLEWSKSFGNMLVAAVTAGLWMHVPLDAVRFLTGFASIAILWSGLYALNDFTDRNADALHPEKKKWAIPSGVVPANAALAFSILLIAAAMLIAVCLNGSVLFLVCMLAMLANQLMYTMKPFNLKKRPVIDLISGSLINPIFRFYAGWVLFVPAFNAPLQVLLFILGMQFCTFTLYKMYSKQHEQKLGMRSSVVLFEERHLKKIIYVSLAISALSYIYATLTVLPSRYLYLGLAMLLTLPVYKTALKRPQDMDHRKIYRLVYAQYLIFIALFFLLYLFPVF